LTRYDGIPRGIVPFGRKVNEGDVHFVKDVEGRIEIGPVPVREASAGDVHGPETESVSIVRVRGADPDQKTPTRRNVGVYPPSRFHRDESRSV